MPDEMILSRSYRDPAGFTNDLILKGRSGYGSCGLPTNDSTAVKLVRGALRCMFYQKRRAILIRQEWCALRCAPPYRI